MAYIPLVNTAKIAMGFTIAGQQCAMTFHANHGSAISVANLDALNVIFRDWWNSSLKTHLSSSLSLVSVTATDLTTSTSPSVILALPAPLPGSVGGISSANNASLVISERTGLRGRSNRGRSYLLGIPQGSTSNAVSVLGGFATNIVLSYISLVAVLASAGWTHVVASRFQGGAALPLGIVNPITAYLVDTLIDSMRRRLAGRGI